MKDVALWLGIIEILCAAGFWCLAKALSDADDYAESLQEQMEESECENA